MATNIEQILIKLFKNVSKNVKGDNKTELNKVVERLQQEDITFPNNADGVDRACLIAAHVLNKNAELFFANKILTEANEKHIKEFSKSLKLLPAEPELAPKNTAKPSRKK